MIRYFEYLSIGENFGGNGLIKVPPQCLHTDFSLINPYSPHLLHF